MIVRLMLSNFASKDWIKANGSTWHFSEVAEGLLQQGTADVPGGQGIVIA
jgi:hypothetical protein